MRADRWLIGESTDRKRTYVVHLESPMFFAQIFAEDDEDPQAILGGLTYGLADGRSLGRIVWIDACPPEDELVALFGEAARAIRDHDRAQ
jgi:hypothetical protein